MNEITKHNGNGNGAEDLIRVLQNSLYPGAKRESVELVVAYCRLNQLDPMLKPVHIVPTNVKVGPDRWETRDTLMPGIGLYRILAARSGEYGGKSEPEFGPLRTETISDVTVTFPEWCRVTISRIVQGHARTFTATERWMENYATAGRKTEAPNAMWRKRAYGQLAKCAEAQALRMAFPEFSGAAPTAEEMEGRDTFNGTTLEAKPELPQQVATPALNPYQTQQGQAAAAAMPRGARIAEKAPQYEGPQDAPVKRQTNREWLDALRIALKDAQSASEVDRILESEEVQTMRQKLTNGAKQQLETIIFEALEKWYEAPPEEGTEPLEDIAEIALP
jgi:phage recombination protein Bet